MSFSRPGWHRSRRRPHPAAGSATRPFPRAPGRGSGKRSPWARRPVDFSEMGADLTRGQALGVEREDHLVNAGQPPLALDDDHGRERAIPAPRNLDLHWPCRLREHRLGTSPVTRVAGLFAGIVMPLITEVLGHLLVQGRLDRCLGQHLQQPVRTRQGQALAPWLSIRTSSRAASAPDVSFFFVAVAVFFTASTVTVLPVPSRQAHRLAC